MSTHSTAAELNEYTRETFREWRVSGGAVAVVQDGEVTLCQGFGHRNLERGLRVTPDTLFPIASCTKAFTSMAIGLLVDSGKLEWDKPVREYLPAFKLHDRFATEEMTVRDLLTHRSGLPRHDMTWYGSSFGRRQILDRLQYLQPTYGFRTAFQYQNLMYMVAGLVIEQTSDLTWEAFVRQEVFEPLGMNRSNFSTEETQGSEDHATPYMERKDDIVAIPFFEADNEKDATGPAGSINSSISDMSKWLALQLSNGQHDGQPYVSGVILKEMHSPQMVMGDTAFYHARVGMRLGSYGLGWMIHSMSGCVLVHHGGHIDGFSSSVAMVPDERVGVVVLSNLDYNFAPEIISYSIVEKLTGSEVSDWSTRFEPIYREFKEGRERSKEKIAADRRADAPLSHPITAYVGNYEHPAYGVASIQQAGETLELVLNDKLTLPLEHYHYDHFRAYIDKFDREVPVSFFTDLKGNVSELSMPLEPGVEDIRFTRLPDKELTDPSFLSQFVGVYDLGGQPCAVALKGQVLTATLPGEPQYTLFPYQGTAFRLQDMPGLTVEFELDDQGQVTALLVAGPGYVSRAEKR
jgi:CubicO group peptidase (beta-lactamase class C family)